VCALVMLLTALAVGIMGCSMDNALTLDIESPCTSHATCRFGCNRMRGRSLCLCRTLRDFHTRLYVIMREASQSSLPRGDICGSNQREFTEAWKFDSPPAFPRRTELQVIFDCCGLNGPAVRPVLLRCGGSSVCTLARPGLRVCLDRADRSACLCACALATVLVHMHMMVMDRRLVRNHLASKAKSAAVSSKS